MNIQDQARGRLSGRRIIITGASSGIGRATSALFIAEGATVVLLDLNCEGAARTLGSVAGLSFGVDISDDRAVAAAIDEAGNALGGIDGVVNAAGIMIPGATADFSFADWHKTIAVNLTGTFNVAKCSLPWLRRARGSSIVNIASATGILPNAPGVVAYAASKGGVVAMTRALAADLAPDIRVNCISPGLVNTPMGEGFMATTERYALKRPAEPIEIANAALFLTSGEASYVTGSTLAVDGGRSFH